MSKYLTSTQYKRYSEGVSLADVSDMTLAYVISRSETEIDSHMGFDAKRGGFEWHPLTVQAPFEQWTLKNFSPQVPVPLRNITRYRIQVSNVSTSGAGFFANINSADAVINNDGHYVEIVPLQAVTYSLSPILIQLGLRPPIIEMDCNVGYFLPVFGEQMIDSGDHTTYYSLDGFWATSYDLASFLQPVYTMPIPASVYVNGVSVNSSTYTANTTDGSVTFNVAKSATDVVTIDYTKMIPDFVKEAAILQTSYLLGQRNLNKMGLQGLEAARTGDQDVRRPRQYPTRQNTRPQQTALCKEAIYVLSTYEQIGIA